MADIRDMLTGWRCRRFTAAIVDYAEGALPEEDRARVEDHLHGCAECRAAVAALQTLPDAIREGSVPSDAERWARQRHSIMRTIRAQAPTPVRSQWLHTWRPTVVAVTAVVAVVVSYRVLRQPTIPLAAPSHSVDALDAGTTSALNDVASATIFQPDWFSSGERDEDASADGQAGQESASIMAASDIHDLSDPELDALGELLGSNET